MYRILIVWAFVLATWAGAPALAAPPKLDMLDAADAAGYAKIFALQDAGDLGGADRLIPKLKNKLLLGHVQFQRYMHPTAYTCRFAELRDWLLSYNDLPEAYRVFSLAMKRKPKSAAEPTRPVYGMEHVLALVGEAPERPATFPGSDQDIADAVGQLVRKGDNAGAADLLRGEPARRALSPLQQDALAADVAMGYFVDGDDDAAYRLAAAAARRSGSEVAQADWTAGLAAYRSGRIDQAAKHFEANAMADGASTWTSAAGAFWAGRMHLALNDADAARRWFGHAARHTRTFYGLLALDALAMPSAFDWRAAPAKAAEVAGLRRLKAGARALALLQIGERWRADQELQPLVDAADPPLLRTILAVALTYGAPRAAVQASYRLQKDGVEFVPAGLYPLAPWPAPAELGVDRALTLAFMRQESQFNPRAASPAGARGLMQLMPTTANYVLGEERYVGARRDGLFDPEGNVAIGARYIRYLLDKEAVDGGLFQLAIAYNAGIGTLIRWRREVKHNDDPLLFIEAIPSRETRSFVERTMANIWIYRDRLGQDAPSRLDVAQGRWPIYRKQD